MWWFIAITFILVGYLVYYWKRGITHPIPVTFTYWLVMLPGNYFALRLMNFRFNYVGADVTSLEVIDRAGFYLFCFLVATLLAHALFSNLRIGFPLVETRSKISLVFPTLALMACFVGVFVAINGGGALAKTTSLRAFASTGFGAYFEIFLETFLLVAIVQACELRNKIYPALFIFAIFLYSILMGRTGLIVVCGTAFLGYLCMVHRRVPVKMVLFGGFFLIPFALLQGILRLRGGLSVDAFRFLARETHSSVAWNFIVQAFASRVNQLDSFAVLSEKIRNGALPKDPLDPLYVFAQVVPRSIWPDKPAMFSDQITAVLAPRVHQIGVVFNFIGPAELIYAFGISAGIILTGLLYGYFFAVFDRYYEFCYKRPAAYTFFAVLVYAPFAAATQAGFFNSMAFLIFLVNAIILLFLCGIRVVRQDGIIDLV